jgi:L-fucose isomerase-like protein
VSRRPVLGVAALARSTFDVAFAEEVAASAFATLHSLEAKIVGPRALLFDTEAARAALDALDREPIDLLVLLQVTFTDACMAVTLAERFATPFVLWGFPEPRTGGRLRLNSLCGINLAAHALGRSHRAYSYLFCPPDSPQAGEAIARLAAGETRAGRAGRGPRDETDPVLGDKIVAALRGARVGVIGAPPEGFHTCSYDAVALERIAGVEVGKHSLSEIFSRASGIEAELVSEVRRETAARVENLDELEPAPLEKSFRVFAALSDLAREHRYAGLAVRCWPEFFTEYGCAACGAMAMVSSRGTPCACEADVYGNVSSLMLQALSEDPVFMADLVDLDAASDTAVFWHCGLAAAPLADPAQRPRATVHSNRLQPLLNEFALRPGRISIARLSQSKGRTRLFVGGGEMLRRPRSFSGTSGVVRFDRPAGEVLDVVMGEGLEHHFSLAYGEHRPALRGAAAKLGIELIELT